MAYDPLRRRVIDIAGPAPIYPPGGNRPVWALDTGDPPTWSRLELEGWVPPARRGGVAAFDPALDRIVVFDGGRGYDERSYGYNMAAVMGLSLSSSSVWDSLRVAGPVPDVNGGEAAAFDPVTRKWVVTRGGQPGCSVPLTYVLDLNPPTRTVDLAMTRDHVNPMARGEIPVAILSEPNFDARRLDPGELFLDGAPVMRAGPRWKTRGFDANGDGLLDLGCRFARHAGDRVGEGNLLVVTGADPEGYPLRGAIRVDGPTSAAPAEAADAATAAAEFALYGAEPNPSVDRRLAVRFSLATAAPATLELFDVSGRAIERREAHAAGPHLVVLGQHASLAPGLYWIRLRQADRFATARAVVLR